MPEFILNDQTASGLYDALPEFTKGYIEAMYFTNGDTGDANEDRLNDLGTERLTREAIKDIAKDCAAFLSIILSDGCFVRQWIDRANARDGYTDAQAGRDFWFSRQGHGVGFWDRGLVGIGDALHAAARRFGEAYCEIYRGWIYHR